MCPVFRVEPSFSIKSHTSQPGEDTFLLCSVKEGTNDRPEVHLSASHAGARLAGGGRLSPLSQH